MTATWTIGVHFREGLEQSRRTLDGVLKYLETQPQLRIRDFNFMHDDMLTSGVPPWAGRVDGMVVGVGRSKGIAQWLLRGQAPVVNTSGDLRSEPKIVSVFTDSRSIAKLAVEHFLQIGKKNIAFIGHRHTDVSRERIEVLAQELAVHHLRLRSFETENVMTGTFQDFASLDQAEPKFVRFLQRARKPLAVLCLNDRFAVAVCRIVHELGFSIPEDAAVLGMGDFELSRIAPIPISSMRTNNEQVGFESARLLQRLMEGHRLAKRELQIPIQHLVVRQSTVGKRRAANTDLDRALEYIQNTACEGIRVEDVANYVQMPLRTFELEFARAMGHPVGEAIRQVRLNRAKHLLETTDLPLLRVAKLTGFTDAANLNRFMVRWAQISATTYRKERLAQQASSESH